MSVSTYATEAMRILTHEAHDGRPVLPVDVFDVLVDNGMPDQAAKDIAERILPMTRAETIHMIRFYGQLYAELTEQDALGVPTESLTLIQESMRKAWMDLEDSDSRRTWNNWRLELGK